MPRVAATRAIAAPVDVVWAVFTDLAGGRSWMSEVDSNGSAVAEDLVVIAVDRGRSCTFGLAGTPGSPRLTYLFTPIAVGAQRGGTAVQVLVESDPAAASRRSRRLANQVLSFMVGTFAARTAEGALRAELDDLAAACAHRVAPHGDRCAAA